MPGALVAVIGKESSMVEFEGRVYTLPLGRSSEAVSAPLIICSSTGTVGETNVSLLMKKSVPF